MEELTQIIVHKLRLMADYRNRKPSSQALAFVEQLLKQKKKQGSREVIQSRLLQTIVSRKIQAPYRIQEFLNNSLYWMKIYDKQFVFNRSEKADLYESITKMYSRFFEKHKSHRRAQQIIHIYEKKLCDKSFLIPTIFNWFVEWVRKTFSSFIKNTLIELNGSISQTRTVQKKIRKAHLQKQIKEHEASLKNIKMSIKNQESLLKVKKSQLLSPDPTSPTKSFNQILNKNILKINSGDQTVCRQENAQNISKIKMLPSTSIAKLNSASIKEENVFTGVNKQVFYGSFAEEMTNYYKLMSSVIPDIDFSYLKTYRRNDKKEQVKNKIEELAKSIGRGQAEIKKTIQSYYTEYWNKNSRRKSIDKPSKSPKKQPSINAKNKKSVKNNVTKNPEETGVESEMDSYFRNGFSFAKKQNIKQRRSRSLNTRQEIEKKNAYLQLPQIQSKPDLSKINTTNKLKKILFINSSRYQGILSIDEEEPKKKKTKLKSMKSNTSRDIRNIELELEGGEVLEKKNSKVKISLLQRSVNKSLMEKPSEGSSFQGIFKKPEPQRYKSQYILGSDEENDGIFYLPKIKS